MSRGLGDVYKRQAPDRPGRFPVVTRVPVDNSYNFPRTELAAMTKNIAGLIDDIDRLDKHRRNMMEELQVLRDVTLFYERHPELRSAVRRTPTEDPEARGKTDSTTPARPATADKEERAGQTPPPPVLF